HVPDVVELEVLAELVGRALVERHGNGAVRCIPPFAGVNRRSPESCGRLARLHLIPVGPMAPPRAGRPALERPAAHLWKVDALLSPAGRMTTEQDRGRHATDARGGLSLAQLQLSDKPSVALQRLQRAAPGAAELV